MRIAIDVRATQTAHRNRGIGRSVFDLVQALALEGGGHEYGLLVQSRRPVPLEFEGLPSNFKIVPVSGPLFDSGEDSWVMRVPKLRSRSWAPRLNASMVERQHRKAIQQAVRGFRADVFHSTAPIDFYTDTTGDFGCRKVVTFYDAIPRLDPAQYYDPMPPAMRQRYDEQLAAVAQADAIAAISKSSRDEAIQYANADPTRTHVVYLAVSDEFEQPSNESIETFTHGEPYFLFFSALEPHKNPLGVVRAFAQAQTGHRLVMLSSHRTSQFKPVQELAQELRLNNVTITDVVSDDAVRGLVQGATALVSPSYYEGFGLPAAQAMRAGIPAIVSNRKSQPEVVGDAGITVDPDNVDALAEAMAKIASDHAYRDDLSARSRARAALFSYDRLSRNMRDVYEGRSPSDPVPDR